MAKTSLFFLLFLLVAFTGLRSAISARVLMDDEVDAESQPQAAAVTPPLATVPSPAATLPATEVSTSTIIILPILFLDLVPINYFLDYWVLKKINGIRILKW